MLEESLKNIDQSSRESAEFMRALFESAPDSIIVIDETGCIVRANARSEATFGYDRTELVGQPMEILLPERFRSKHVEQRAAYFSRPQTRQMGAGIALFGRRKGGAEFPVDIMLSPLKATKGDMVIAVIRDITERREAEKALHHMEETIRLLVEGVQDYAIFMLDCEGKVVSWNAGAQNIKGYTSKEIIGSHFSVFYLEEDVKDGKPDRELAVALACGRCQDEGLRRRKDGSTFWADVTITRVQNESGETIGFSKVTRDISDRKRAEDTLAEVNRQREDFVATLTHDLKTPVVAANRAIKLLIEGDFGALSDEQITILTTIIESNDMMYGLITSLLDVYRYDGGSKELVLLKHDLVSKIEKLVLELSPIAISQSLDLKTDLPKVANQVLCDFDEIRRVIQNLIDNALKFTQSGGTVEVGMRQADGITEISIRDNGKGISREDHAKLFQRFWAPAASGRQYASTGLGLYLCRKIVELHGGEIHCESEVGKGSVFSFTINRESEGE
jgi:PAS domain S-box-containing protein